MDYPVAGGVKNLAQMIDAHDEGKAFFEKSYLTRGMEELFREGLLRLSGQTDQILFELALFELALFELPRPWGIVKPT